MHANNCYPTYDIIGLGGSKGKVYLIFHKALLRCEDLACFI